MKKFFLLGFLMVGLACMFSCSSDDVEPSVTFGSLATDTIHSDMVYPTEGGTQKLTFNSNVDWTISVAPNASSLQWCTASMTSGTAGNNISVDIVVDENTGVDDRSTVVTITAGTLTKKIVVTQKQKNSILITKQKFEFEAAGGSFEVEAKANVNCQVEIPAEFDWISETTGGTRAMDSHKYKFNVAPSEEYEKREGYILIKGDNVTETVSVYQSGSSIVVLTQNNYNIDSEGGSITTEIKSNCEFEVIMPDVDWVKQNTGTRAVSSHTLTFEIAKNEGYDSRSAQIVIKDLKSENSEVISINQLQKDAMFVGEDDYNVEADGGNVKIQLSTNVKCTAQIPSSCSWIHVSQSTMTRGLSDESITLTVDKNNSVKERSAEIVLTDSKKNISKTITIKQDAQFMILSEASISMIEGETKSIQYQLNSSYTSSDLVWSSNNTSVVTVTSSGELKAIGVGEATVTIKTKDAQKSIKFQTTVASITDYIAVNFLAGDFTYNLGYFTGLLGCQITNKSNHAIYVKDVYLTETAEYKTLKHLTYNSYLNGNENLSFNIQSGNIYKPILTWYFQYNGKEYQASNCLDFGSCYWSHYGGWGILK